MKNAHLMEEEGGAKVGSSSKVHSSYKTSIIMKSLPIVVV
jgi:hypothetical protein